jgi:Ca-activated chloride channel family protein
MHRPNRKPKNKNNGNGLNGITINAEFDRNKFLESGNSVRYLVVDVNAPQKSTGKILPINLALVIDASSSMEGPWLDAAKEAAIGVIRTLRSEDRISVISFSSDVQVHCDGILGSESGKQTAISKISDLRSRDMTDLGAGWLMGAESVTKVMAIIHEPMVSRVVVLSDGMANRGIGQPTELGEHARELLNRGIVSTSVGIGPNYSSIQLQAIADNGGGTLHHASHPNEIIEIVVAEMRGMREVAAEALFLEIRANAAIELECLSGYVVKSTAGQSDYSATVSVGTVISGVARDAVFKIACPPLSHTQKIDFQITARWTPLLESFKSGYASCDAQLTAVFAPENKYQNFDQRVGDRSARVWLACTVQKAIELNTQGHQEEAGILLKRQERYFRRYCNLLEVGPSLKTEWDQALMNVRRRIDPLIARESSVLYSRSMKNQTDHRSVKYRRAFSKIESSKHDFNR